MLSSTLTLAAFSLGSSSALANLIAFFFFRLLVIVLPTSFFLVLAVDPNAVLGGLVRVDGRSLAGDGRVGRCTTTLGETLAGRC